MTEANPFDLDTEDADETGADGAQGADSANMAELRKFANKRDREAKALQKELEALREFKAEVESKTRAAAIDQTFKEVGLNPKHAALFSKVHGTEAEVTAEAVQAFASEYELPTTAGEPVAAPEPKPTGFNPVTTGSTPSPTIISIEDANKLIREGKYDEAQRLYAEGKVEKFERDANGAPVVNWLEG